VGIVKMLAALFAALGLAAVESGRTPTNDEDDLALFVGSAHPLPVKLPISRRRR
jgi:hypothetical protein